MTLQRTLSPRDIAILQLLNKTPATTDLILKASVTFPDEPFRDARRVREKLQTLVESNLVRAFPATQGVGGPVNWYKLTKDGFLVLHGSDRTLPHRSRFEAISPSRFAHTATTAEIIVHTLVAAHMHRIETTRFHSDGELVLESGEARQIPDCHFGFECAGRFFNVLFEIDNSTEPLNSVRLQSIRSKLQGYEAYQDSIWHGWKQAGEQGSRPYFRVIFLTKFVERALHILWCQEAPKPSHRKALQNQPL